MVMCIFLFTACQAFAADKTDTEEKKTISSETRLKLFLHYLNQFCFQMPVFSLKGQDNIKPKTQDLFPLPERRKPRLSRAIWTGLAHFTWATSSYWIRQDVMKEDWEYQLSWNDQKRRFLFLDGMRFDSNTFSFNWTHSGAGAMYYTYARGNHFNTAQSMLYTVLSSYFWEFVVEFKEVVSINDMIATPIGGLSIGESMFQLGRFFRSGRPTLLNRIARIFSNPLLSVNDWLDRKRDKNQYAFKEDFWHDVRINFGPRYDSLVANDLRSYFNMGLESHLVLVPEYGTPDLVSKGISKTISTEFNINLSIGSKGIYEYQLYTKAVLFGYFYQDIRSACKNKRLTSSTPTYSTDIGKDDRTGYSFFLGLATAFDMFQHYPKALKIEEDGPSMDDFEYKVDKYTVINLLGPTVDFTLFQKGLVLRLTADAFADFSLIHSHAYKRYSELNEFGQTKATLQNHGYYYAWGFTLASKMQLNYKNLEFKGKFKYHFFDSIEGLDRFQPEIEADDDFDLGDQRLNFDLSLGYQLPRLPIQLVVGYEQRERRGDIGELTLKSTEKRTYFQIRFLL